MMGLEDGYIGLLSRGLIVGNPRSVIAFKLENLEDLSYRRAT